MAMQDYNYDTTDPGLWPNTEAIVLQVLVYKNRAAQLRRELKIANRMVRDAEEALSRSVGYEHEYLTWET